MGSLEARVDPSYWGGNAPAESSPIEWLPAATPSPVQQDAPGAAPAETVAVPPKPNKFRLKIGREVEEKEELVTPEKAKSWGSSLAFHILLLLLLAFAVSTSNKTPPTAIETGLPAGDPHGSDLGQFLTGGKGMDEPLATPLLDSQKTVEMPALTSNSLTALNPNVGGLTNPLEGSRSGGGVALTGTGQAGSGDGFGVAKFGLGGSELVNNVSVKVGDPQFTLIWDTNVDLDLHVQEPGGSHISFEYRQGRRGGELDVDDLDGFGPENVYWGGGLNKGNGPGGEYKWFVHYYGGAVSVFGRAVLATPTRYKVRIKHNGKYEVFEGRLTAAGQQSKPKSFTINRPDGEGSGENVPAREGERERFENPPSQIGAATREVNTGSFEGPGTEPAMAERNSERPAPAAAPANETKPAPLAPPARIGPPRDERNWVIVRPAGAGFEVRMPDEPIEQQGSVPDKDDAPDVRTWSLSRIEGAFTVALVDLGVDKAKADPTALIESEARAELLGLGATNTRMKPSTAGANRTLEVEADLPDRVVAGGGFTQIRFVLVGQKLYRASVMGTREFVDHPDARTFLGSFQIAPTP